MRNPVGPHRTTSTALLVLHGVSVVVAGVALVAVVHAALTGLLAGGVRTAVVLGALLVALLSFSGVRLRTLRAARRASRQRPVDLRCATGCSSSGR